MLNYPNSEIRSRVFDLHKKIKEEMAPCADLRIVSKRHNLKFELVAGVPLCKKRDVPFIKRVEGFKLLLEGNLLPAEKLRHEDNSFIIESDKYILTYCLEGYRKHADMVGYYKNGVPVVEIPKRPGVVWARHKENSYYNPRLRTFGFTESEKEMIWCFSNWDSAEEKYPDLVGQYVYGVKSVLRQIKKDAEDLILTQKCADMLIGQPVNNIYIDKGPMYWWMDDEIWDTEDVIIETPIGFFQVGHTIDNEITIHPVDKVGENYLHLQFKEQFDFKIRKLTDSSNDGVKDALCISAEGKYVTIFAATENIVINCYFEDCWGIY